MKKYLKTYFDWYGSTDAVCELTGRPANYIHHIEAKRMGGSKLKDNIENLMGIIKEADIIYGDRKQFTEWLKNNHLRYMNDRTPLIEYNPEDENLQLLINYLKR